LRRTAVPAADQSREAKNRTVYVITIGFEFGTVDLGSGTFLPIGPELPPDVGVGLVPGPGTSLLTLGFSGNLVAINPRTGNTTVVGATGLADCLTPDSPCGPNSANALGYADGHVYATDFANNLYSVDLRTGAAKLIGPTGMPGITFIPFTSNPDGTLNVYGESLFSARGNLYASFSTAKLDPETGAVTMVIPNTLYEINPRTGRSTMIAPIDANLTCIVNVGDTAYGFDASTGQVVTLDLTNGHSTPVSDLDPAAGVIAGATPARPAPASGRQE
jgi:hypothetical protein